MMQPRPTARIAPIRPAFLAILLLLFHPRLILADPTAGQIGLLGVRGNETATRSFAEKNHLVEIVSETKEFDNGNTAVRFAETLPDQPMAILLPEEMNSNQLMEALIKIRTARSLGAPLVRVVLPAPSSQVVIKDLRGARIPLRIETLLAEAGADSIQEANETRPLAKPIHGSLSGSPPEQNYLVNLPRSALGNGIAMALRLSEPPRNGHGISESSRIFLVSEERYSANDNLFKTLSEVQSFKAKGARVSLIAPYLPYARSDKVDQRGITTVGRLLADLIEDCGTDEISFVRAHTPQSTGFFRIPARNISGRSAIENYLRGKKIDAIVSPDNGFAKDATLYADELHLPAPIVLNKQRDPITGEAKIKGGEGLESLKDKRVVIIDDEMASGSTQAKAAEAIKRAGAVEVYTAVTHIAGSAKAAIESPDIDEIIVTNTLPLQAGPSGKIKVLDISPEVSRDLAAGRRLSAASGGCAASIARKLRALAF